MKRIISLFSIVCMAALLTSCGSLALTPADQLQTPQYTVIQKEIDFSGISDEDVHRAEEGIRVIVPDGFHMKEPDGGPDSVPLPEDGFPIDKVTPETVWEADNTVTYNSFTLPDKAMLNTEGCVGILSIPSISLNMNIYESDNEMEAMLHGGAHYKSTSSWDGNIGISAHVSGVPSSASFENLHKLEKGDTIVYQTALGTRSYTVSEIMEIAQDDWGYLGRTADNRITLTTCIPDEPEKRLLVQAHTQE